MIRYFMIAAACVAWGIPASAQTISAQDPAAMAEAMKAVGYKAELGTDAVGDPQIVTDLGGWQTHVLFYDCNADSHDACQSIQLSTGFDRKTAMTGEKAQEIARQFRFAQISLDDEGDPYVRWDILTGDGLPSPLFFSALRRYAEMLDDVSQVIFEE